MTATHRQGRIFTGNRLQLSVIGLCTGCLALMWIGLADNPSLERDYAFGRYEAPNDNLAQLFGERVWRTPAAVSITHRHLGAEITRYCKRLGLQQCLRNFRDGPAP